MALNRWIYCLIGALLAIASFKVADACSCMMEHPQTHYCTADFVIVATVRRKITLKDQNDVLYKLKIRKEFKMSEKAKVALKAGMVMTAENEALCGVDLERNLTYLLTGRIVSLQAHISLCGYQELWKNVTPRQRKGFRALYKQGCPCRITHCTDSERCNKIKSKHICKWWNSYHSNCHNNHGVCLINREGVCHWARARKLTECLRDHSMTHDLMPMGY